VARIFHGSKCVGHGKCAEACPVNAIAVGLGDVSQRPDIPALSAAMETRIPGLYIAESSAASLWSATRWSRGGLPSTTT